MIKVSSKWRNFRLSAFGKVTMIDYPMTFYNTENSCFGQYVHSWRKYKNTLWKQRKYLTFIKMQRKLHNKLNTFFLFWDGSWRTFFLWATFYGFAKLSVIAFSFDKSHGDSWPEYGYNLKQEYNVGMTLEKWWNNKRLKMSLSCGICCYLCYNQMTMMIIAFYLNPLTWIGPIFSNPYEALPSDVYMYILSFL